MTAQEQVKIVQRREKALFEIERTLFDIGTNKHSSSIKMASTFYERCKKIDRSGKA